MNFSQVRWPVTLGAASDSIQRLRQGPSRWIEASGEQGFSKDPAVPPCLLKSRPALSHAPPEGGVRFGGYRGDFRSLPGERRETTAQPGQILVLILW